MSKRSHFGLLDCYALLWFERAWSSGVSGILAAGKLNLVEDGEGRSPELVWSLSPSSQW